MSIDSGSIATFGYYTLAGSGATGGIPIPGRPTRLIANPTNILQIRLDWRMGLYSQYFRVYRALSSTASFNLIANYCYDTFYTDKDSLVDKYYWYKVSGVNEVNEGSYSNIVWQKPNISVSSTLLLPPLNYLNTKLNRNLSLFFNDREWQFVKHISRLMVQHVAKQQVYYFEMDLTTMSSRSKIYGLSKRKIWKKPKKLYGRVKRSNVKSDRKQFGFNSSYNILIYFDKNHLDQLTIDINYMVGNQILWDHKSFIIRDVQFFDSINGLTDFKITVVVFAVYTQD